MDALSIVEEVTMSIFKKPKAPAKTAEQKAGEIRTRSLLDKEIEEEEERLRFARRGKLGQSSLLSGAARNISEAARGVRRGGASGAGSLLGRPPGSRGRRDLGPPGTGRRRP